MVNDSLASWICWQPQVVSRSALTALGQPGISPTSPMAGLLSRRYLFPHGALVAALMTPVCRSHVAGPQLILSFTRAYEKRVI